ncbi:Cell cycle checkpoint protein rad17 [Dinochytrium kinnereticum]|nr:Cell cycle checkpoint protein rad17 [Dinochytrium kinnereticum]
MIHSSISEAHVKPPSRQRKRPLCVSDDEDHGTRITDVGPHANPFFKPPARITLQRASHSSSSQGSHSLTADTGKSIWPADPIVIAEDFMDLTSSAVPPSLSSSSQSRSSTRPSAPPAGGKKRKKKCKGGEEDDGESPPPKRLPSPQFKDPQNEDGIDSFDDDDDFFFTGSFQMSEDVAAVLNRKELLGDSKTLKWKTPLTESMSVTEIRAPPRPAPPRGSRPDSTLWVDKYCPVLEEDLAVNKKRVAEVRSWISRAFEIADGVSHRRDVCERNKILVLTGPSGSGKTATLRMLAAEMGFDVLEWINPVNQNQIVSALERLGLDDDFHDLPNISHGATKSAFHDALREFWGGRFLYPLVVVVSDVKGTGFDVESGGREAGGSGGFGGWMGVVPEDLKGKCTRIGFRPVATRELTKCLTRIAESENLFSSQAATREVVQRVAENSGGDVRCAVNALQFVWLGRTNIKNGLGEEAKVRGGKEIGKGRGRGKGQKSVKARKKGEVCTGIGINLEHVGGREASLVVFHALGKILNGKRVETKEQQDNFAGDLFRIANRVDDVPLPPHLKEFKRLPLKSNPESVFQASHLDSSSFISYLSENSLSYLTTLEECRDALSYFAESDAVMGKTANLNHTSILSIYAASIAARGMCFARTESPPASLGFFQIRKPKGAAAAKEGGENWEGVRGFFGRCVDRRMESAGGEALAWGSGGGGRRRRLGLSHAYSKSSLTQEIMPFLAIMLRGPESRTSGNLGGGSTNRLSSAHASGNLAVPVPSVSLFSVLDPIDMQLLASVSSYSRSRPTSDFSFKHQEFLSEFDAGDDGCEGEVDEGIAAGSSKATGSAEGRDLEGDDIEEFWGD